VLLAGAFSFLVMIGGVLGILFVWSCGIASGLFLTVALFSGTMWFFTRSQYAFQTMLGFLVDAAVPFAMIVVMSYYYGKLTDKPQRRQRRTTVAT